MARAQWVRFLVYAFIVFESLSLLANVLALAGNEQFRPDRPMGSLVTLGYFVVYLASVVAVSMWIHRAHANLFEAGFEGLEFTPGWSVGWFFVPIASLFKPFQAMRELWNASLGASDAYNMPAPPDLSAWWGGFIIGNMLANIESRIPAGGGGGVGPVLGVASSVAMLLSAWFLLKIVIRVTDAQASRLMTNMVFA